MKTNEDNIASVLGQVGYDFKTQYESSLRQFFNNMMYFDDDTIFRIPDVLYQLKFEYGDESDDEDYCQKKKSKMDEIMDKIKLEVEIEALETIGDPTAKESSDLNQKRDKLKQLMVDAIKEMGFETELNDENKQDEKALKQIYQEST